MFDRCFGGHKWLVLHLTWKTLGAETRKASADDKLAAKMPAVMRGPKPDTVPSTLNAYEKNIKTAKNLKLQDLPTYIRMYELCILTAQSKTLLFTPSR